MKTIEYNIPKFCGAVYFNWHLLVSWKYGSSNSVLSLFFRTEWSDPVKASYLIENEMVIAATRAWNSIDIDCFLTNRLLALHCGHVTSTIKFKTSTSIPVYLIINDNDLSCLMAKSFTLIFTGCVRIFMEKSQMWWRIWIFLNMRWPSDVHEQIVGILHPYCCLSQFSQLRFISCLINFCGELVETRYFLNILGNCCFELTKYKFF